VRIYRVGGVPGQCAEGLHQIKLPREDFKDNEN